MIEFSSRGSTRLLTSSTWLMSMRLRRRNNGVRLQSNRSYHRGGREPSVIDSPGKLCGTRGPNIHMQRHGKMRDWSGIPDRASMNEMIVDQPTDLAWGPFNREAVTCLGRVKPEFNIVWST